MLGPFSTALFELRTTVRPLRTPCLGKVQFSYARVMRFPPSLLVHLRLFGVFLRTSEAEGPVVVIVLPPPWPRSAQRSVLSQCWVDFTGEPSVIGWPEEHLDAGEDNPPLGLRRNMRRTNAVPPPNKGKITAKKVQCPTLVPSTQDDAEEQSRHEQFFSPSLFAAALILVLSPLSLLSPLSSPSSLLFS
ncbi:hypothetical protein VTN00DRAFT_5623 [Thermoascus crustaceus]|uniref:uncharacterized protein n=1 Tax=Thermoascus crustaceus TaxID=5088 RepID=UPI003742F4CD